jgi:hypothetical protein
MNLENFMPCDAFDARQEFHNPVDWFNRYGDIHGILETMVFRDNKKTPRFQISGSHITDMNSHGLMPGVGDGLGREPKKYQKSSGTWTDLMNGQMMLNCSVPEPLKYGNTYSKFELLTIYVFKNDAKAAENYVEVVLLKRELPFIRVGCDYFKILKKPNAFGVKTTVLKAWKKETLKDDYGQAFISKVPRFSDFINMPDNKNFQPCIGDMFNLYAPFPHKAHDKPCKESDFKHIALLIHHIFGDQTDMAYKYFKILYELPTQILPVLVLTSRERQTGKTTFLNLLAIIFGDNHVQISPDDLTNDFNSSYAHKNIIVVDETSIEKQAAVERIKSISTAKTITVNQKHVAHYAIPFYGKIVLATNREKDFMKIDEEEIRFWVRKVKPLDKKITDIESKMVQEVPKFLRYLEDLPEVDRSRDRMVFTAEELVNEQLQAVIEESRSWLYKEIFLKARAYFEETETNNEIFFATIQDVKDVWFAGNNNVQTGYVRKVLLDEMKLEYACDYGKTLRYYPFWGSQNKPGRPLVFTKAKFYPEGAAAEEVADAFTHDMLFDKGEL